MVWFWLNIPLATVFFLAWTLIPLWLVIKRRDTWASAHRAGTSARPSTTGQVARQAAAPGERLLTSPVNGHQATWLISGYVPGRPARDDLDRAGP